MTLAPPKDAVYYEQLYQTHDDPWAYGQAAEQAKYRLSLQTARRWQPHPARVLEVACSLGYLTEQLADYADEVYAFDLSETAVRATHDRCRKHPRAAHVHVRQGDATQPGYPEAHFDVVFLQDVLLEIPETLRPAVLEQSLRLLKPGGILVVNDYQQPSQQEAYCQLVQSGGGRIVERIYFHDRGWFRLKSALKAVRQTAPARALLQSERVFRWLSGLSARRGPEGSKHFGLVVQRNS